MYFKDKSTALQSKLNKVNNTGTQMQETFIIWNNFFQNFIYNFHTRLGKGKVLKHFENFNEDFWLKFRLSLCSKDYNSPSGLKKGIDIQLRESFSKSPSRMSQVHVLAV